MIHASHNVLVYDAIRGKNIDSYTRNPKRGDVLEQNTNCYGSFYADYSQDIFKDSIDDSQKTINSYAKYSVQEIDGKNFESENDKIGQQIALDEALVETMTLIIYGLKEDGNIKDIINKLAKQDTILDVKYMSLMLLNHSDGLDAFKWMIDPLDYADYIHYDYLTKKFNTKEDNRLKELIISLYEEDNLEFLKSLFQKEKGR